MIKRIGMKTLTSAIGHGIDEFANSYGGGENNNQSSNNGQEQEPGQANVFETKRPHNQKSAKKIASLERRAQRKANQGNFQPGKPNMNRRDEYQNNIHSSNIQAVLEPLRVENFQVKGLSKFQRGL
jgi:hypothetical protein